MHGVQNSVQDAGKSRDKGRAGIGKKPLMARFLAELKSNKVLWFMLLPGIVYFIIFNYWPMYGIVIAFQRYSPFRGITGSQWVGFRWFIEFFQSIYFVRIFRNTIILNLQSILFGFPAPIIFALLLNEIVHMKFKKVAQTISYMPHFISQVVTIGIVISFLSPTTGVVNHVIKALGFAPVQFMTSAAWFRPVYVISGIWAGIGWGSILYLAALTGINPELYEAAIMDGASRLRQIWHISLPGIMPTIVIMLLMSLGSLVSIGYEKIILMYNPLNYETSDVIATYVYRRGLIEAQYSFATAVGLFQSVINFILLAVVNQISKRVSEISLW